MNNKNYALILGIFLAAAVLITPFSLWQVWFGTPIYDAAFGDSLGTLPVQRAGRIMPLSSASADVLRQISGRTSSKTSSGDRLSSTNWLWRLAAYPELSSKDPVFRTDNRDLQKLLGAKGRYYSYSQLLDNYEAVYAGATSGKTPYAEACTEAVESAIAYALASNALIPRFSDTSNAEKSLENWKEAVETARKEFESAQKEKREPNPEKLSEANRTLQLLKECSAFEASNPDSILRVVPSLNGEFSTPTAVALDRKSGEQPNKIILLYSQIRDAIASGNKDLAYSKLAQLSDMLHSSDSVDWFRIKLENLYNLADPFFCGFLLYSLSLLFFLTALLVERFRDSLKTIAVGLLSFGTFVHVLAFCARMYIQSRPPVTNMYSSIVFVGGVAAAMGLFGYFKTLKSYFGVSAAGVGFLSLLVAMNMPYSGDNMGMMRAVLNSNFWLTMHVVTIMVGYCGILLAGSLAAFRLVANVFDKGDFGLATGETSRSVYAILCFALVFAFAGTMLGGVWADMSWGRFWGWDPKENGALMTVLWCAAVIHARALKLCSDRIFLSLTVLGNIVLAWAWFGVNLLGIGLHSYGFTDGGWLWFGVFVLCNLAIAPLGFIKYKKVDSN